MTAAIVLAAGGGSRFTGPTHKLLAPIGDRTVIEVALDAVLAAPFDDVIVVTGAIDLSHVLTGTVIEVHNPSWADGQATSLAAGVDRAASLGHDAVVVGLGDQPGVGTAAWTRLANSSGLLAIATYDGRRRNPVRLSRAIWPLLSRTGDEGARTLVRTRPDLVVEVPCDGSPDDIDTEEDLSQWN